MCKKDSGRSTDAAVLCDASYNTCHSETDARPSKSLLSLLWSPTRKLNCFSCQLLYAASIVALLSSLSLFGTLLSYFARLSEEERIYKRNEVERWTRMSYELLNVQMSLFYAAYIPLYLTDLNNRLQPSLKNSLPSITETTRRKSHMY